MPLPAKPGCDRICADFMFLCACTPLATKAPFVLQHVMPELVGKNIGQHETPKGVPRP